MTKIAAHFKFPYSTLSRFVKTYEAAQKEWNVIMKNLTRCILHDLVDDAAVDS